MGLEEVKKEILNCAQKERESILATARKEASIFKEEAQAETSAYRKKVDNDTGLLIAAFERKEIAAAEFDLKKALLEKKREIIDKAFEEAYKIISGLSGQKRADFVKKLVMRAQKEIPVKNVFANAIDKAAVQSIKGIMFHQSDISGGIIAENDDGTVRIDYSIDELLACVRKQYLQETAAILFGK